MLWVLEEIRVPIFIVEMDINQIFDLFSSDEEKVESTYVNFDEHPYYNIGMFKKLIFHPKTLNMFTIK